MKVAVAIALILVAVGIGGLLALGRFSSSEQPAGYAYSEPTSEEEMVPTFNTSGHAETGRRDSAHADKDWLTSFELIERSGRTVRSDELKGQPYIVGFFFTLCPSICLNQNAKVKELQDAYQGQPLKLLSISCDPEVDRPEVLAEYAKRFEADEEQWLFLTGDMDYITRVAGEMYFLAAERRFHAEKFVLVDADGHNVGFYTWSDPAQFNALKRDIDKLLSAGGKMPASDTME